MDPRGDDCHRHTGGTDMSPRRHSGAGPPAWMQVVERRREQAAEESSGLTNHFRNAGMPTQGMTLNAPSDKICHPFTAAPPLSWIPAFAGMTTGKGHHSWTHLHGCTPAGM